MFIPALPGTVAGSAAAESKNIGYQPNGQPSQHKGDSPRCKGDSKAGDLYASKQPPETGEQGRNDFYKLLRDSPLTKTVSYR